MTAEISKLHALDVLKNMLFKAYEAVHGKNELKRTTSINIDIATRGDAVAGEAMIAYLKGIPEIGVVYTEEQGKLVLNKTGNYSAIIDDIDGTKNFKEGFGMLPHGSIAGIFEGRDPKFKDCIASGYLDFPSGNFFYAIKGEGCFVQEGLAKKIGGWDYSKGGKLATTGRKKLFIEGKNLTMLPDIYMFGDLAPALMEYSAKTWLGDFRTSAAQLALVAAGSADIFVTCDNASNPNKHKTGEELGPAYLMIKEAGGALTDWTGEDVGEQKVGLGEKKPWHAVAAATPELAKEFAADMRNKRVVRDYMKRKELI